MTSSAMSTSPELGKCRSSAILLSSSATGFSKSRYVVMWGQVSPGSWYLSTGRAPASTARQRMLVLHQRAQLLVQHMRVDLRGGDVGVAEHELHAAQVGAAFEQVAG